MGRKSTAAVGRWSMAIIPAIVLLFGGLSKFTMSEAWVADFESWGYAPDLVPALGLLEVLTAVAILVPMSRFYGAGAGISIMMVASMTRFVHGEIGGGIFTLAIAGIAAISGWWARPYWFHRLVVRERPQEVATPNPSRRARK